MVGTRVTLDQLQERLAYWSEKLRVQDWEIRLEWGHPREMTGKLGTTTFLDYKRQALILLTPPDHIAAAQETHFSETEDNDLERTLVHELLHVRMRGFEPTNGDVEEDTAHAFIHEMSGLLVELDRKNNPQPTHWLDGMAGVVQQGAE